ncbi:hypothetical protein VNO77_21833 [Canavalia gladiata]|uniref:peroxidase n=1 Tax=Canavalia gladiata TaxID=3824 RepID=A0AAN9L6N0_CANGL
MYSSLPLRHHQWTMVKLDSSITLKCDESKCSKIVSCVDILTLATRDVISIKVNKPTWEVIAVRRDGTLSKSSESLANIPTSFFNFTQLKQSFASKGLTLHDLAILLAFVSAIEPICPLLFPIPLFLLFTLHLFSPFALWNCSAHNGIRPSEPGLGFTL